MSKPIRLYFGDARQVLPRLARCRVDAVIADPPFGIVAKFGSTALHHGQSGVRRRDGSRTLQFAWDEEATAAMVADVLERSFALCKPAAGCVVFTGFDQSALYAGPARRFGFVVKPMCWVKKHPPPASPGNWWPSACEFGYYGYRPGAWFGDRDPKRSNVFVGDALRHGAKGKTAHPTQKPLDLMLRLVESIVPPGGLCLDPFLGSGTTAEACRRLGRRCIGIEWNPDYFAIARQRLNLEGRKPQCKNL